MLSTEAILRLHPDDEQAMLLETYALRYAEAANWLCPKVIEAGVSDQVRLHRLYYSRLRESFGLPSQAAVLCLKHVARACTRSTAPHEFSADGPLPYDRHLFSMKSVDLVSLATLEGRVVVPCTLTGYGKGEFSTGSAELCHLDGEWVFVLRTDLPEEITGRHSFTREDIMSDTLLTRIARLVSGLAHNAIEQAEGVASVPVMEQAIRDIDAATTEVRAEIGKHEAVKHNLARRVAELQNEHDTLSERIAVAVKEEKDNLAEAGVGRQIDIENQLALLERSLKAEDEEIEKLTGSLAALQASRREAQARLRNLQAAAPAGGAGSPAGNSSGAHAQAKAASAMAAAERLGEKFTGVPGDERKISNRDLDDLAELHRQNAIQERLAKHKARMKSQA